MIKTVLASLTGTRSDRTVMDGAVAVAKKFGSHIQCLHVKFDPVSGLAILGSRMSGEVARDENERSARARQAFDDSCRRTGLPVRNAPVGGGEPSLAWQEVPGLDLDETPHHGRHHDIIVVGRDDELVPERIPEIVLTAGRPILVPPAKPTVTIGEHLAVAWKPGPESARALTAAAPLLSKAKRVTLIFVPEGELSAAGASAALNELAEALRWHDIEPELLVESPSGAGVGETIRTAAYNVGADLLVMGAYGHSRLREFVLGGATRTIIAGCEIPVLLFH